MLDSVASVICRGKSWTWTCMTDEGNIDSIKTELRMDAIGVDDPVELAESHIPVEMKRFSVGILTPLLMPYAFEDVSSRREYYEVALSSCKSIPIQTSSIVYGALEKMALERGDLDEVVKTWREQISLIKMWPHDSTLYCQLLLKTLSPFIKSHVNDRVELQVALVNTITTMNRKLTLPLVWSGLQGTPSIEARIVHTSYKNVKFSSRDGEKIAASYRCAPRDVVKIVFKIVNHLPYEVRITSVKLDFITVGYGAKEEEVISFETNLSSATTQYRNITFRWTLPPQRHLIHYHGFMIEWENKMLLTNYNTGDRLAVDMRM